MKKEGREGTAEILSADLLSQRAGISMRYDSRLYTLSELAKILSGRVFDMLESGLMPTEALGAIGDGVLPFDFGSHSELATNEEPRLLCRAVSLCDRVAFVELLLRRLAERGYTVGISDFFPDEELGDTVTYLKGALADEAFDLFSEYLPGATVAYSESLREGAQALADGKASFLIAPLEERGGMRIPSVVSLINRLSLKIAAVTPVYGFMGDADMKYALLSNSFMRPALLPDDDLYLELALEDMTKLTETLFALESLSHEVYRLFSLEGADGAGGITLIIRANPARVAEFISYLTVFIRDFSLVGIYKNLE